MKILISQVSYSVQATLCLFWILLSSIISANTLEPTTAVTLIDENGHAEIPSTYTRIDNGAFRDTHLISVAIPNSVTSIGEYAFQNTQFVSVIISGPVTTIDRRAFKYLNGEIFFIKPTEQEFSIYDFPATVAIYACDGIDEAGNLLNCDNAYPKDENSHNTFAVNNGGAGQVIYTAATGARDGVTYSLSVNSAFHSQTRAIEQRFVDNADGSITLQLLVDASMAYNYSDGIENLDLVVSYNLDEIEYITADHISTPSNPFASFFNTEYSAGDILLAQVYFPTALNLASEIPILEVDFTLKPWVTSAQFEISGVMLNNDDLTDMVSGSRYLGDDGLSIDVVTGAVTLFTNPNYESQPQYSFTVTTTNDSNISSQQAVVVTVVDSAEQAIYRTTWDFDGNGQGDALTDGMLLVRYEFDLRDSVMVEGAVAENSPLSHTEIQLNLDEAKDIADINGDGQVRALSDGLLLLRHLFGLGGNRLVKDAVYSQGSRQTPEDIAAYINSYMPVQ